MPASVGRGRDGQTTERAEWPDLRSDREVDQTSGTTEEEMGINKLFCADRQGGREREHAAGLPAVVVPCGDTGYRTTEHQDQLTARNDAADQPKRCCHTRHCPGAYNNEVMARSMVDMFETAREKKTWPMLIPSLAATNFVHQVPAGARIEVASGGP